MTLQGQVGLRWAKKVVVQGERVVKATETACAEQKNSVSEKKSKTGVAASTGKEQILENSYMGDLIL